jgi:hypothetical protein
VASRIFQKIPSDGVNPICRNGALLSSIESLSFLANLMVSESAVYGLPERVRFSLNYFPKILIYTTCLYIRLDLLYLNMENKKGIDG